MLSRRHLLSRSLGATAGLLIVPAPTRVVTLFLCGDVMTGRGIDQILPHPGKPDIHESYLRSAADYVRLAEHTTGPIRRPVGFDYVWGDALAELGARRPAARIVNLETTVTAADKPWPGKGIHYRMHPANLPCLAAAGIDCCVLANNHVLDWGYGGLHETLERLHAAGIVTAGAGADAEQARAPAIVGLPSGGRVLVFAMAMQSSGVPPDWAARADRPGVHLLPGLSRDTVQAMATQVRAARRAGDLIVASIHWGANWGYGLPAEHRQFAHGLIDSAGVDVVHGHSSHHPLGIEVYRGRLILHGCGDFLNDYEGIGGHDEYRPELVLMYLPTLDRATGELDRLDLTAMQIRHLRLQRASGEATAWLAERLSRVSRPFGTALTAAPEGRLEVRWEPVAAS
jgi:poly-gamma-glutamate synthesis protein (capsule biosynthesis protein)